MTEQRWVLRRGTRGAEGWETVVDSSLPGWEHTALRVAKLGTGDHVAVAGTDHEHMVIPLAGSFTVTTTDEGATTEYALEGRASVFAGPTDVLYVTSGAALRITGSGRVAVASAPTSVRLPTRHLSRRDVPIELRGAGSSSRQVHNFGTPGVLPAARLIVCEVVTPGGNWSSYPPHKHDELVPGHESRLEEIYYFDAQAADNGEHGDPFGFFSVSSSPAGEIEIDIRVHPGDVALVPYGYHGPAIAAPGYDLHYLNVMAGPDPDREWLITDDPAHAWVRETWLHQQTDPRLPFGAAGEEERS